MSEKRFRVEQEIFDGYCIVDTVLGGYYAYDEQDLEKLCKILNRLSSENEQLKEEIKDLNDVLARYEETELEEWVKK